MMPEEQAGGLNKHLGWFGTIFVVIVGLGLVSVSGYLLYRFVVAKPIKKSSVPVSSAPMSENLPSFASSVLTKAEAENLATVSIDRLGQCMAPVYAGYAAPPFREVSGWKYYYQSIAGVEGFNIKMADGTLIDGRGGSVVIWAFTNPPGSSGPDHTYVSAISTDSILPLLKPNDFVAVSLNPEGKLNGFSVLCYYNP